MKKIFYDGQEFEKYIISTNDKIEVNEEIIKAIKNIGQNLSHEIYEVGEIDDRINPTEAIQKWMEIYFEGLQDGSINYITYVSNALFQDNKFIQNYICEIEYSIKGIDNNSHLIKDVFKLKSKINIHTEF